MTSDDISQKLGVSRHTVHRKLRALGLRVGRDYKRAGTGERPNTWTYDWDSVDWENEFDSEIARRLGCSSPDVTMFRKRNNKPRGPDGRKVSPLRNVPRSTTIMTPESVREMRDLYATGDWTHEELAQRFGIARSTAQHIIQRRSWSSVP